LPFSQGGIKERGLDCDEGAMIDIKPQGAINCVSLAYRYQFKSETYVWAWASTSFNGVVLCSYIRQDVSDTKTHFTAPYQVIIGLVRLVGVLRSWEGTETIASEEVQVMHQVGDNIFTSGDFCQLPKTGLRTKISMEYEMTIFDPNEKVEFLAAQCLHYDRYVDCQCFLERVDVDGKSGLVCGEESDGRGTHSKILLEPIYDEISIRKTSSHKAIYDKYAVFANGDRMGDCTLVLNAWVPFCAQHN
jgi:hypothetical protein